MIVIAAVVLAVLVGWSARVVARELRSASESARRTRALTILALFRPGLEAAEGNPRALVVWQPIARAARALFPDEFAEIDRAHGAPFPFGADRLQAAHAQWTAEWLGWERAHDAEYKIKAAAAEQELTPSGERTPSPAARAKLDTIEREKLELYQRRYEEYVRVAKALQALISSASS